MMKTPMTSRALAAPITALVLCAGCDDSTGPSGTDAPFKLEVAYEFPSLTAENFIVNFGFGGDGSLWVGTFQGSVIRVKNGQQTKFDGPSVPVAQIRDLFIDSGGRPWIAAGNAVAVFENEAWKLQSPPGFFGLSPKVGQVAVSAAGDVLLGVGDFDAGGLLLRRGGQWQAITPFNSGLPGPITLDIDVAPDGSFWVVSDGGVSRIAGNEVVFALKSLASGLLYTWIDDVAIGAGRVWLGYDVPIFSVPGVPDGGMQSLSLAGGDPVSYFPYESGLSSNRVRSIVVPDNGEVWFSTTLDEDSGCKTCVSSVGFRDASGRFHVVSYLNSDLEPNAFMPWIGKGPNGDIYVAHADRNQILKVVR